jgi:hypothetical protein
MGYRTDLTVIWLWAIASTFALAEVAHFFTFVR